MNRHAPYSNRFRCLKVVCFIVFVHVFGLQGVSAANLLTVDFETANSGYSPSYTSGSGPTDIFNRTNTSLGGNSSWKWAVEDKGSDGTITLDAIDISSVSDFTFSVDMLTPNSEDWDTSDEVLITYSVDGGGDQNLMWIQSRPDGDAYNAPAALDLGFDGDGDSGQELPAISDNFGAGVGSNFETFSTGSIAVSGNSLVIKIEFIGLTSTAEGIYMDNFVVNGTVAASNDTDSSVSDTGSQPVGASISSLLDTPGEAFDVFEFRIEDAGSGDGVVTSLTNIRIKPGSNNTADWTDAIAGVTLDDGSPVTIDSMDITDAYIDIVISAGDLEVSDGGSDDVMLAVYFTSSGNLNEGDVLEFMIDADDHGWDAAGAGSDFESTLSGGDFDSNNFTINVVGTALSFSQQPTNVGLNENFSPSVVVAISDVNGNPDTGASDAISLSTSHSGGFSAGTTSKTATSGTATFGDIQYNAAESGVTITASASGFSDVASDSFNVTNFDYDNPTALSPGDVAIVSYACGNDAPNYDGFSAMLLANVGAGTEIYFTDHGWTGSSWRANEGVVKYTVPAGGHEAGKVIQLYGTTSYTSGTSYPNNWSHVTGSLAPNTSSDSIIAFQCDNANSTDGNASTSDYNDVPNTTFLGALQHKSSWDSGSTATDQCANPFSGGDSQYGLTVRMGSATDNQVYNMVRTLDNGTKQDVWNSLNEGSGADNRTNWNGSSSYIPSSATMKTNSATLVAGTSATLNGAADTVDAGSDNDTNVFFVWGTDAELDSGAETTVAASPTTITGTASNNNDDAGDIAGEEFSEALSGLTPGTTYYFRAKGVKNNGSIDIISYGAILSFSTPVAADYTVSTSAATVSEDGSTVTESFTVVLDAQPSSNVKFDLTVGDTTEVSIDKPSLTFTNANWDTPQTVTITGVDDDIIDGDIVSNITISIDDANSDDNFDALADETIAVTTTDDDSAGFTVSIAALNVAENGGTNTFTVVLDTEPSSDVVFSVTSSDTGEATVSPATLTFTPVNWDTPQTITATGVNDSDANGDDSASITVSVIDALSDDSFDPLADQSVAITVVNDDVPSTLSVLPATSMQGTQFDANWTSATGATSYELDVDDSSDFSSTVFSADVGNVTSRTVTGLTAGTTYYYRVRPVNGAGSGADSDTALVYRMIVYAKDTSGSTVFDNYQGLRTGGSYTLDELFGGSLADVNDAFESTNGADCTTVILVDSAGGTTFYYYHSTNDQWEEVGDGSHADQGAVALSQGQGFIIRSKEASDFTLYMSGVLRSGAATVIIQEGYNLVSTGLSSDVALSALGIEGDVTESNYPGETDWVGLIDSASGTVSTFFYSNVFGGGAKWLNAGYTDATGSDVVTTGNAFWIYRSSGDGTYNWSLPTE